MAGWLLLGNRPIFADIDGHTLAVDPKSIPNRITTRTKAILAVDIFGIPSDTGALRRLADEYGIWYIADAAQSLGARRQGLPASALADAIVVSFTSGKTLSAGEGGAVLTNHSDLYEKLIWWTQHPARQRRDLSLALDNEFSLNGRIHPEAAREANAEFEPALERLRDHQLQCWRLIDILNGSSLTEQIDFQRRSIEPSFFRLTAAWLDQPEKDRLAENLAEQGLQVNLLPPPVRLLYRQPAFLAHYSHMARGGFFCPQAEQQAQARFSISK